MFAIKSIAKTVQ